MATPMRTISVKLTARQDKALTDLAKRRKSTRSALVREALEGLASVRRGSVTDLVDEFIEPIYGPGDLSTNPKYMEKFGK